MADKVVQLTDKDGNNIFPTTQKNITMTDVDPGEGAVLAADNYVAVYGGAGSLIDIFYPVGSIYMSATISTAQELMNTMGGVWVAWGAGRVPVGVDTSDTSFDTVEETGGYKTNRHVAYCPPINSNNSQNAGGKYITAVSGDMSSYLSGGGSSTLSRASRVASVGGSIGDNSGIATEVGYYYYTSPNLQPYITCYMYKRIA